MRIHYENFRFLLRFRASNNDTTLKDHLKISNLNAMYTIPQVQNEKINIFGKLIQFEIVKKISKFFSVIACETTDISQIKQFSLCMRYPDEKLIII